MNAKEYLEILHVAEILKDTPRHCTTSRRRTESVAEHSWRVSLMAFLLKEEFPDVDINKVVDMCLIHDLGECFTGDIPTFIKTDADRNTEDSLLDAWVKSLPDSVSKRLDSLYKEIEAQATPDNEYELNKTYAFDAVAYSEWLTDLRNEILKDTLEKIDKGETEQEKR